MPPYCKWRIISEYQLVILIIYYVYIFEKALYL